MEAAEEYNLFALDNFFCQNNTLFLMLFSILSLLPTPH